MKRTLIIALSFAVALMFAGLTAAQTNPQNAQTNGSPTTLLKTPTKPPMPAQTQPQHIHKQQAQAKSAASTPSMKPKMIMGAVVSVDAVANTIVVNYKGVDRTFAVDPTAKIMVSGKACKLADIPKDAKITVVYRRDAKANVAIAIK
jgi:hypothetical protein